MVYEIHEHSNASSGLDWSADNMGWMCTILSLFIVVTKTFEPH